MRSSKSPKTATLAELNKLHGNHIPKNPTKNLFNKPLGAKVLPGTRNPERVDNPDYFWQLKTDRK